MLVQFTFSNFKSFKEPATLSLTEANITEYAESLLKSPKDDLGILPLAVLYGPNGGGKSNTLEALCFLGQTTSGELRANPWHRFDRICKNRPTGFEIIFRCKNTEYNYQLKTSRRQVIEETMFYRTLSEDSYDTLFDRDAEGIFLGEALEDIDVQELEDNTTTLSFLADRYPDILTEAIQWLRALSLVEFDSLPGDLLRTVCDSPKEKKQLLILLGRLSQPISDLFYQKGHLILSHKLGKSASCDLLWEEESKGLRQAINLLALIINSLRQDTPLLLDDANRHLHPKVLQFILELFTNPKFNKYGLQLICTSSDLSTMSNAILRRDEIWLTCLDTENSSSLYTLADCVKENGEKVRKDETYYKQYLEGRYGADPDIKFMLA